MNATTDGARKFITEEIPVASSDLLARVRALLEEGRVRHIKVKSPTGEVYFEVPLAIGVLGGAALAWASPWLAMAGALAGMVTSVKLEISRERTDADRDLEDSKAAADKEWKALTGAKRSAGRTATAPKRGAKRTPPPPAKAASKPSRTAAAKKPRQAATKPATRAARGKSRKTTGRR